MTFSIHKHKWGLFCQVKQSKKIIWIYVAALYTFRITCFWNLPGGCYEYLVYLRNLWSWRWLQHVKILSGFISKRPRSGSISCITLNLTWHTLSSKTPVSLLSANCYVLCESLTLQHPKSITGSWFCGENPQTDKTWNSGAIRRPSQRNVCPDPRTEDNFEKVGMTNSTAVWSTKPDKLFSCGP